MKTLVHNIAADVASNGMALRKASPRGPDRLLLELTNGSGEVLAGQWHRDSTRGADIAARTRARGGAASVDVLEGTGIFVQRGGADRRLPALQHLVRRPGARLVAHRAERRGVVRNAAGDYTKAVRPGRLGEVTPAMVKVDPASLTIPRVTTFDAELGTLTTEALPGRTLQMRLADPALSDDELARDGKLIGSALRHLHASPATFGRRPHTLLEELRAARRWLEPATEYSLITAECWQGELDRAAALLSGGTSVPVLVHRDLHDKQILIDDDHPVGMLDFDLATSGEPAVDLANLLVHLQLRSMQGSCSPERAAACGLGLLEGYACDRGLVDRLPAYALSTRLRLAAVYAFRATSTALLEHLLHPPPTKEFPWARP